MTQVPLKDWGQRTFGGIVFTHRSIDAIVCNGQVARQIEHSSGLGKCRTYGRYDKDPIDLDLLRSGENKIVLRISVFSESSSEQPKDSYLKIQVRDVLVDIEFADRDVDGLLDLTDPMVGENNLIDAAAVIMFGMPILGYAGAFMDRRRE
jgi:hypothetical protein